jgi:hypothetical protein
MKPSARQVATDKLLTQFSIGYRNQSLIAEMILPRLSVKKESGKYAKYGKDGLRLAADLTRAPGAPAKSTEYSVSQGEYFTKERALVQIVPDEVIDNADDPFDPRRDATLMTLDRIALAAESVLASLMTNTAVLTNNVTLTGTDQWSDYDNSDPMSDVKNAKLELKKASAISANAAVMNERVFLTLKEHPDVVDRVKYVGAKSDDEMVAAMRQLFNLQYLYVGDAVANSANEGQADSIDYIWGNDFVLFYKAPRPSLMTPAFGYTIAKQGIDRVVERWYDQEIVSEKVRVRDSYDQIITSPESAYLIKNAVAAS